MRRLWPQVGLSLFPYQGVIGRDSSHLPEHFGMRAISISAVRALGWG